MTIPQDIRERLGLLPNAEVVFDVVGDAVRIRKAPGTPTRGAALLGLMRRAGAAQGRRLTTDEILALTRG